MSGKAASELRNSKPELVNSPTKQSGLLSSDLDHLFAEQERIYRAKNPVDLKTMKKKKKKNQRVSLMELEPMKGMVVDKNVGLLDRKNDMLLKQIKYKEEMNEERRNMVQRLEQLRTHKMELLKQRNQQVRAMNTTDFNHT